MADIAATYVMTAPGGTVTFNAGGADQFYIQALPGFDSPQLRTPVDPVPFGDGAIVHDFWKGARQWTVEGVFLITSTLNQDGILTIRNQMEEDLQDALDSMLQANATWAWTPFGGSARTLNVRWSGMLECPHDQNFLLRAFQFGLIAGSPDW